MKLWRYLAAAVFFTMGITAAMRWLRTAEANAKNPYDQAFCRPGQTADLVVPWEISLGDGKKVLLETGTKVHITKVLTNEKAKNPDDITRTLEIFVSKDSHGKYLGTVSEIHVPMMMIGFTPPLSCMGRYISGT